AGGARSVVSDSDLAREITVLLNNPGARADMVRRARVLDSLAPDLRAMARRGLDLIARARER
ncbi:MAG: hypothetical protein AAFR17_02790, partial [Pseudomonadota bacterium]